MLMRRELIDGSIKHFSRSLRQIRSGFITDFLDELVDNNQQILRILNFRLVMSLNSFRWKILQHQRGTKSRANAVKIWFESIRLDRQVLQDLPPTIVKFEL